MIYNIYFFEHYAQMRQKEFQEAARLEQLIQKIEAHTPGFWPKLMGKLGDWMIVLGHRLREDNLNPMEVE